MEQALFRALGDPTRRAVYERLAAGEMNVAGLTALLDVTQPAVSQHLAALKGAGLVSERREGRRTYYKAEPAGLDPLMDWMARTSALWPERIERLRDLLKRMDR
ncbi:MAG TPA: metalloregulator ArsR/SmtB family transcription factor [Caulobacteraceae bacterium]|jgi:DNA-binding transcriptional ArsR family regulator|nr:metalloregulator ArsR/SmtB family transcription factor [Caulobacteraceae bacterium]